MDGLKLVNNELLSQWLSVLTNESIDYFLHQSASTSDPPPCEPPATLHTQKTIMLPQEIEGRHTNKTFPKNPSEPLWAHPWCLPVSTVSQVGPSPHETLYWPRKQELPLWQILNSRKWSWRNASASFSRTQGVEQRTILSYFDIQVSNSGGKSGTVSPHPQTY